MPNAKLIVAPFAGETREVEPAEGITSLGRAPDNTISFAGDTNVSRYHAEIERRGDNFYVIDLGSSNGTTVNGAPLHGERKLQDGDTVIFGGDSRIEFRAAQVEEPEAEAEDLAPENNAAPAASSAADTGGAAQAAAPAASKLPVILAVAAVLGGLAVVSVVAMVLFLPSVGGSSGGGGGGSTFGGGIFSGGCSGSASILTPENGITISEETPVKLDVKNPNCIERIIFQLDGEEIASVETPPYAVTLAPENMGRFADENSHVLTVAVQSRNGGKPVIQADELTLAFSDDEGAGDDDDSGEIAAGGANDRPAKGNDSPDDRQVSLADSKQMSERLIKQLSGGAAYKLDAQFLQQVQKKTAEYKKDGYYNRAAAYRDQINIAFVNEKGLDAPLGYLLAMSRTGFDLKNQTGKEQGLWQMTDEFAAGNGYKGQCGADTLGTPNQECAARAAAVYTKSLIDLYQGDVLYAVACFGMSPQEAGQFQLTLPPDRSDFWNALKGQKQRDNLVKFFAAAIVAENPSKFGLKRDKPLSNLYKNLMVRQP